ncbi:MAG: hypothetical protein ABEJ27_05325 [Halodesulfurarchaeum sp.]
MVEIRALESARQEASGFQMYLLAVWYWTSGHVSLTIAIFGGLMIVIGGTLLRGWHDVFAGMFGVWGVTLIVLGLAFDLGLRFIALYEERKASV